MDHRDAIPVRRRFVALLIKGDRGPTITALADASGNFTLSSAPGSHAVGALKAGFVFDSTAGCKTTGRSPSPASASKPTTIMTATAKSRWMRFSGP